MNINIHIGTNQLSIVNTKKNLIKCTSFITKSLNIDEIDPFSFSIDIGIIIFNGWWLDFSMRAINCTNNIWKMCYLRKPLFDSSFLPARRSQFCVIVTNVKKRAASIVYCLWQPDIWYPTVSPSIIIGLLVA